MSDSVKDLPAELRWAADVMLDPEGQIPACGVGSHHEEAVLMRAAADEVERLRREYDELKRATWHEPDEPDQHGGERSHAETVAMANRQSVAYCLLADFANVLDDQVWLKVEEKLTND